MTTWTLAYRLPVGPRAATLVLGLTAICFGLVPLFARELQAAGVSSPAIAFYRYAFSALLLLPFLPWAREKRREMVTMLIAGVMVGLGWIGYLKSLEVSTVAAAGVVYMSYPLFAVLLAWLVVGQRPTRRALLAGGLVLVAAAATMSPAAMSAGQAWGLLVALPAPISFAFIIVLISAKLQRLGTLERLSCGMLGASVGLLPLLATVEGTVVPTDTDTLMLVFGITAVTAFIPQLLYTFCAPRVGPARAAATGSLELPVMFAVGWLAFGESVGPRELLAAVLVLSAIFAAPAIKPAHSPVPVPPERV